MILIHFKSIVILDTLLILLENLSKPQSEAMDIKIYAIKWKNK